MTEIAWNERIFKLLSDGFLYFLLRINLVSWGCIHCGFRFDLKT